MSSPSSADSDDRPLGQQSIHDSDSEPSENSGSDRQLSESSGNSDSDRQVIGENSHSIRRRGKRNRHVSLVSDESSPERRRRKPAVDLFTALPDSLLLHVLSFLPIEDAVKTQVLSKRCQYLWTYITSLVFSIRSAGRCDRDFVAFVDKTLVLSNCSKIKKLGVQFGYAPDYESSVDLWTQFAAGKRAEELQLAFEDANDPYLLPQLLYTNSSFKTLQFNTCDVMPEGVVRWNSLKRLSIGHAKLSEDVIQKILAGSPVLEILELYRCHGFTRLHVSNASVKKLKLRHVWVEDPSGLEISASQLHSLEVSGRLYDRICRLGNVSSLVDANLNFHERIHGPYSDDDFERYSNMLRGLLQSLVHVKKMTLGTWALQLLQVFSSVSCQVVVLDPDSIDPIHWNTPCYSMNLKLLCIMEEKGQRSPLLKCECLRLDTGIRKSVIPGIAHMLESSPDLETLVITKSSYGCHEYFRDELGNLDGKHYWSSRKKPFTCLMFRLKQVKLIGLVKSRVDDYLTFVQFILMNARVLQKMVIDAQMRGYNWQKEFTEFPRSSPDAVVMFCQ